MTKFTEEQGNYIRANYHSMSAREIGDAIGLSDKQVIGWAHNHGVSKGRSRLFTDDELDYIEQNYLTTAYSDIAQHLGYTTKQVTGWINHNLPKKNRIFNDRYFQNIVTPNQAYWLGFIYADGWISCHLRDKNGIGQGVLSYEFGMELQSEDEYILHQLNNELGGAHTISQKHKEKYICGNKEVSISDISSLRIYSKKFVQDLEKCGIDFNKTQTDRFPVVSDDLFLDFLRGYIDGDGCIHKMSHGGLGVHITGANRKMLEYICEKLSTIYGISSTIYTETNSKHRLYCFRKADVRKLLDLIYHDVNCIKLVRKYKKYIDFYGLAV